MFPGKGGKWRCQSSEQNSCLNHICLCVVCVLCVCVRCVLNRLCVVCVGCGCVCVLCLCEYVCVMCVVFACLCVRAVLCVHVCVCMVHSSKISQKLSAKYNFKGAQARMHDEKLFSIETQLHDGIKPLYMYSDTFMTHSCTMGLNHYTCILTPL